MAPQRKTQGNPKSSSGSKRPRVSGTSSTRAPAAAPRAPIGSETPGMAQLVFTGQAKKRYEAFKDREVMPGRFFNELMCKELGIWEELHEKALEIGWPGMMTWRPPVFEDLTREFFATVQPGNSDKTEITFRVCGRQCMIKMKDLTRMFGFSDERDPPMNLSYNEMWHAITGLPSWVKTNKARDIPEDQTGMLYMQRFLAGTLFCRENGQYDVTLKELWILTAYRLGVRAHWESVVWDQLLEMHTRQPGGIGAGCVVTQIVWHLESGVNHPPGPPIFPRESVARLAIPGSTSWEIVKEVYPRMERIRKKIKSGKPLETRLQEGEIRGGQRGGPCVEEFPTETQEEAAPRVDREPAMAGSAPQTQTEYGAVMQMMRDMDLRQEREWRHMHAKMDAFHGHMDVRMDINQREIWDIAGFYQTRFESHPAFQGATFPAPQAPYPHFQFHHPHQQETGPSTSHVPEQEQQGDEEDYIGDDPDY